MFGAAKHCYANQGEALLTGGFFLPKEKAKSLSWWPWLSHADLQSTKISDKRIYDTLFTAGPPPINRLAEQL